LETHFRTKGFILVCWCVYERLLLRQQSEKSLTVRIIEGCAWGAFHANSLCQELSLLLNPQLAHWRTHIIGAAALCLATDRIPSRALPSLLAHCRNHLKASRSSSILLAALVFLDPNIEKLSNDQLLHMFASRKAEERMSPDIEWLLEPRVHSIPSAIVNIKRHAMPLAQQSWLRSKWRDTVI